MDIDLRLDRQTNVLGVSLGDTHKAYVLADLRQKQVINDEVGSVPIVLIASPISDSVRVYERKNHQFTGSLEKVVEVGTNDPWVPSEETLSNPKTGESLERVSDAFTAFWFAWFVFHPDILVYDASVNVVNVDPDARLLTTWGEIKE